MTLTDQELTAVLKILSPTGIDYQAGRIVRLLAQGPSRTGIIASTCSVGNLADVCLKTINPRIAHLGLWVACIKPSNQIRNKFGQIAGDWIYSFYRANIAANDDNHDDGSSEGDWGKELNGVFDDWEKDLAVVFDGEPDLLDRVLSLVEGTSAKDWEKELEVVFDDEPESGLENLELDVSTLDNLAPDLAKVVLKQGGG